MPPPDRLTVGDKDAELDARLPGWARTGVGRADGRASGEFSAILYRTDRLALLDSGTFWLSS